MERITGLGDILFLDIETAPLKMEFRDLSKIEQEMWKNKTLYIQEKEGKSAEEVYEKAGIYAEFGKIICISTAYLSQGESGLVNLKVKSYYGDNEQEILKNFALEINKNKAKNQLKLCGHNSKEFDIPYICRRMIINNISLPGTLSIQGKKPWEINHIDTMEMWKFGDYKHYTSLQLLANILGLKTPKDDISGSDVARVYWKEKDLERIRIYCEKDTVTVAQVYLRMIGKETIDIINNDFSTE
jgi:3'-5' exonuclease